MMSTTRRQYCSVYGCMESSYKNPGLSFFCIPQAQEKRKQWLRLISREELINKNTSHRICHKHFNQEDIVTLGKSSQMRLKKDTLPSLNLPTRSTDDKLTQTQPTADTRSCQTDQSTSTRPNVHDSFCQTAIHQFTADKIIQTAASLSANTPRERKLKSELKSCQKRLKILETEQTGESQEIMFHELCDRFLSKDLAELAKAETYLNSHCKGNSSTCFTETKNPAQLTADAESTADTPSTSTDHQDSQAQPSTSGSALHALDKEKLVHKLIHAEQKIKLQLKKIKRLLEQDRKKGTKIWELEGVIENLKKESFRDKNEFNAANAMDIEEESLAESD